MGERADVAVIGGGPAGLAAATRLRELGVEKVVLLERDGACGGATRHCGHPAFGMRETRRLMTGGRYAARLEAAARARGVDLRTRHAVRAVAGGTHLDVISPAGRSEIEAGRVVLTTGAREAPRSARLVGGERPLGIMTTGALQSCLYLEGLRPFRRPVIVGTELVGLSSLLTCRTHGIRPAAVIETAPAPIARWPLTLFPALLGIPRYLGAEILDIQGHPRVERVVLRDAAGQIREIACDGVVFTGRFVPEGTLAAGAGLAVDRIAGGVSIDQFGRTSEPRVFAAGNGLRPVETAGWCWAEGRTVAACIAADLRGELPAPDTGIEVRAEPGLRFVTPRRIWPDRPTLGLRSLQLRLEDRFDGRLTVACRGRPIWSRSLRSRAERRILVPIAELRPSPGADHLTVALQPRRAPSPGHARVEAAPLAPGGESLP